MGSIFTKKKFRLWLGACLLKIIWIPRPLGKIKNINHKIKSHRKQKCNFEFISKSTKHFILSAEKINVI